MFAQLQFSFSLNFHAFSLFLQRFIVCSLPIHYDSHINVFTHLFSFYTSLFQSSCVNACYIAMYFPLDYTSFIQFDCLVISFNASYYLVYISFSLLPFSAPFIMFYTSFQYVKVSDPGPISVKWPYLTICFLQHPWVHGRNFRWTILRTGLVARATMLSI